MSEIGSVESSSGIFECLNTPSEDFEVKQDLDKIANLVVCLRTEAQQTGGKSKITDLESMDQTLRALAKHFNSLSPNQKQPYYDLLSFFQQADLVNVAPPFGDNRRLCYNGESMPKEEWEQLINSLFEQDSDGNWLKGPQLKALLVALKPYGDSFNPPE